MLRKHLAEFGDKWTDYTDGCMLSYNGFTTPNMDGLSPYEMVLGHKLKIVPNLEIEPKAPLLGSHKQYYDNLRRRLRQLHTQIQNFRDKRADLMNKDRNIHSYHVGQLVYMYQPRGAILQTGTRKFACEYVGPLVIYKAISPNQFLLMSIDGKVYPQIVEETRLKEAYIRTPKGNVTTLADLKSVLKTNIKIDDLTSQ
jgi:hypothetical protein